MYCVLFYVSIFGNNSKVDVHFKKLWYHLWSVGGAAELLLSLLVVAGSYAEKLALHFYYDFVCLFKNFL